MILQIREYGDPVLRQECEPVTEVDDELCTLAENMLETMYDAGGIGLAAPQVGVSLRFFVYDVGEPDVPPGVMLNPEIVEERGSSTEEEGCLSIPGIAEMVRRPESIRVRATGLDGEEIDMSADGLLGRCIQHETDHLNGVLFWDRVSPLKRRLLQAKWRKREKTSN